MNYVKPERREKLINKAKRIRNIGVICVLFELTMIGMLIGLFVQEEISMGYAIGFYTIIGITALLAFINFINVIVFMCTDWELDSLQNSKVVWGILGLLLIGLISTIAFGSMAKNQLERAPTTPQEPTKPQISLEQMQKLNEYNEFLEWKRQQESNKK